MKIIKLTVIAILVLFIGYSLYLVIEMSSTYPSIKQYKIGLNKNSFEQNLSERIKSHEGWSFEKKDSVKDYAEVCYWASLFNENNQRKIAYDIKYCFDPRTSNGVNKCIRLEIVGAFDHVNKSGGYKLTDKDVQRLIEFLDMSILNDLAPACLN